MRRFSGYGIVITTMAVVVFLLSSGRPAHAQVTPDQYVQSVTLGSGEVPGYRQGDAGPLPVFGQIGALAAYGSHFTAESLAGTRVPGFVVWTVLFPSPGEASAAIRRLRTSTRDTIAGYTLLRTPDVGTPITGADEAIEYRWIGSFPDGRSYAGLGVAWRFGPVFIELFVYSTSELGRTSGLAANDEMYLLAQRQSAKYNRTPKYTPAGPTAGQPPPPPPATTTPPPAQPSKDPQPDMLLLVTAQIGGAIARDGTTIRAYVGERECGAESLIFGWTFLSVASADTKAGCGGDGAIITFRVGDQPAAETVTWALDSFVRGVPLTAQGERPTPGLLVRPVASISCRPALGSTTCSELDRRLWEGSLRGWLAIFEARGAEPSGEALLTAWARFRAERDEVLGNLVLAVLERRSYSFISAVRYAPGPEAPHPYLEVSTVGAGRVAEGWRVLTADGGEYVFPPGAQLAQGACRIYLSAEGAAADTDNACPGAVIAGTTLARPGAAYLMDERGEIIDSVGF